jgi:hypothetical protein
MQRDTKNDVLLLTDQAGTYYAIPLDDLWAYRVSEERREEIEKLLGVGAGAGPEYGAGHYICP